MVRTYYLNNGIVVKVYEDRIEYTSLTNDTIIFPKSADHPPEKEINGIKHHIVSVDPETLKPIYGFVRGDYIFEYNGAHYTLTTGSTAQKLSIKDAIFASKFLEKVSDGIVYIDDAPHKILICCGKISVLTIRGKEVGIYALSGDPRKHYSAEELIPNLILYKTPEWFKPKRVLFSSGENGVLKVIGENRVLTTFAMEKHMYTDSIQYTIEAFYGCEVMPEKQPSKVRCLEQYIYPSNVKINVEKLFKLRNGTQIGRSIVTNLSCLGCNKKVKAIVNHFRALILLEKPERKLHPWEEETINAIVNGRYTPYTIAVLTKNGLVTLTNYTETIEIKGKRILVNVHQKAANFGKTVLPRKNLKTNTWNQIAYSNGILSIDTNVAYPIAFVKKLYSGEEVKHTDILPNFPENESFKIDFRKMELTYTSGDRTFVVKIWNSTEKYIKILHPAEDGVHEIEIGPGDEAKWGDLEWVKKFPKVKDYSAVGVKNFPKKATIEVGRYNKIYIKTKKHVVEYDEKEILIDGEEPIWEIFQLAEGDLEKYLFTLDAS